MAQYRIVDDNQTEITHLDIPKECVAGSALEGAVILGIENGAFSECVNLKTLDLDAIDGYFALGQASSSEKGAFEDCISLDTIIFPTDFDTINIFKAFRGCTSLTSLDFSNITNGKIQLGLDSFMESGVIDIDTEDVVETIGAGAFQNCLALNSFTTAAYYFGGGCFLGSSLKEINFNNKDITTLGPQIFKDCDNLDTINFNGTKQEWLDLNKIDGWNIDLPYMPIGWSTGAYQVHCTDGDTPITDLGYELTRSDFNLIGYRAEYYSSGNKLYDLSTGNEVYSVVIPDTITKDGETIPIERIAKNCFNNFTNITSVQFGNNIKIIGKNAFSDCSSLNTITFSSSVKIIGYNAFAYCNLTNGLTLPANLEVIGDSAFQGSHITGALTIPDSVRKLGINSFMDNTAMTQLTLETVEAHIKDIPENCFQSCYSLTGSLTIPDSVETLGYGCFGGTTFNNVDLSEIVIGYKVHTIGDNAFQGRRYCPRVYFTGNVIRIGDNAFNGMNSLLDIDIPNTVEYIGSNFVKGSSISSLTIPDSVKEVGDSFLYNNRNITYLDIDFTKLEKIGLQAFASMSNVNTLSVDLPNITEIGGGAFQNTPVDRFKIGKGITSVGYFIFGQSILPSFTEIEFYGTVSEWQALDSTIKTNIKNSLPASITDVICSDGTTTII